MSGDKDFTRSFEEITTNSGFHFEDHTVTTSDGYINKMYRVRSHDIIDKVAPAVLM